MAAYYFDGILLTLCGLCVDWLWELDICGYIILCLRSSPGFGPEVGCLPISMAERASADARESRPSSSPPNMLLCGNKE